MFLNVQLQGIQGFHHLLSIISSNDLSIWRNRCMKAGRPNTSTGCPWPSIPQTALHFKTTSFCKGYYRVGSGVLQKTIKILYINKSCSFYSNDLSLLNYSWLKQREGRRHVRKQWKRRCGDECRGTNCQIVIGEGTVGWYAGKKEGKCIMCKPK